ncbi:hypothetical protein GDO81_013786 [Engystomops pustulosus]|uniref:Uncharacterized protein n=1 Tax=Engystomops pustulosus TaxID=76066 RepID=A0AAV7B5N7_ENGPU|nr:hypothetical protein GDO81_013786 [Engystomops pustulosus]
MYTTYYIQFWCSYVCSNLFLLQLVSAMSGGCCVQRKCCTASALSSERSNSLKSGGGADHA